MATRPFRRAGPDRIQVRLSPEEAELLHSLPGQLRAVLLGEEDDPVSARLFPPAYKNPEDAELDAEYRSMVLDELRAAKLAAIETLEATLARGSRGSRGRRWSVELTLAEAEAWLTALNDLRLALGVRIGIKDERDYDEPLEPDDPRAAGMYLLTYLGWLQEHLVGELMR